MAEYHFIITTDNKFDFIQQLNEYINSSLNSILDTEQESLTIKMRDVSYETLTSYIETLHIANGVKYYVRHKGFVASKVAVMNLVKPYCKEVVISYIEKPYVTQYICVSTLDING